MSETVLVIERGVAARQYWRDLWHYRDLLAMLAWRDISVRYKQTLIGIAWAVLRPFLTMVVFTFVFGHIAKLHSEGAAPYALMVYAGMLPWFLFSTALGGAAESIVSNANLIGKVYFPRLVIPAASTIAALVDFLVSAMLLIAVMAWYRYVPPLQVLLLPFFVALAVVVSIGPGLWLSSLNVKYRDFRYIVPFILQFGLYISPVGFSSAVVPERWRVLYSLNPMVGVIEGFRWCLLGGPLAIESKAFLASVAMGAAFLAWGLASFRKTEKSFADIL